MKVSKQGSRVVFSCTMLESYLIKEAIYELRANREAGDWDDNVSGILVHQMMNTSEKVFKLPWKFDVTTRKWQ